MSYQYNLKEEKGLVKVFECTLSGFDVGKQVTAELEKLQANAHLKGFRKGKAPLKVIEEMYFGKTFYDVVNNQASQCIAEITKEKSYKLASQPKIDLDSESSLPADRNVANIKDLKMLVSFELLPEIKEIDFAKIDIKKYVLKTDENAVNDEIQKLAKNHATTEDKGENAVVENGDIAVIDVLGYQGGETFEGGKVVNHQLLIGSNSFIPGFEEGLINAKKGEVKTLNLVFPEKYHMESMSGKPVEFVVTILNVLKSIPAQINDELAKRFGFNTIEDLRADVKKSIAVNYENAYKMNQKTAVFDQIQTMLDFEVPHSMLHKHEHKHEEDCNHDHTAEIGGVRLSIFLMDYAQKHKIEVSKADFMKYIESMARMYGQNPQTIYQMYQGNKQMQDGVYNILFENKIFEHLYSEIPGENSEISKDVFDEMLAQKTA